MRTSSGFPRPVVFLVLIVAALAFALRSDRGLLAASPVNAAPFQAVPPPAAGQLPGPGEAVPGPIATPERTHRGGQPLPPVHASVFGGSVRDLPAVPALPLNRETDVMGPLAARPPALRATGDAAVPSSMPAPSATFAGLAFASSCSGVPCGAGYPPDPVGDVGPSHYVEAVNSAIGIFDKSGNRLAAFTFNSLWVGAGTGTACDSANQGDPVVVYDHLADRWIVADFAYSSIQTGPYYECFAVSRSGDPVSGGWFLLPLRADDASHPWLNDYTKIGLANENVYITANEFLAGATFKAVRIWAINRVQLEAGLLRAQVFDIPYNGLSRTGSISLLPANLLGPAAPAGTPGYLASEDLWDYMFDVYKLQVDWDFPASSTLSGPIKVSQAQFDSPSSSSTSNIIPQAGSSTLLDSLGERLMMQLQYRNIGGNESLWLAHTVRPAGATSGPTGIQWAQLNVTGGAVAANPVQQQIFTNGADGPYRWVPSIAVDRMGNAAIGYSTSSSTRFPSIEVAGRLASDPLNTLGQGVGSYLAGAGSQNVACGGAPCSRWGDYTSMTVDPADDCTFWYVNEYYVATGGSWATRIGSFKYPACPPPPGVIADLSIRRDGIDARLDWTNPPYNDSTRVLSSSVDPYLVSADPGRGIYAVPAASWNDPGVTGDQTVSTLYYHVLGRTAGAEADPSSPVGLFEFGLAPGQ